MTGAAGVVASGILVAVALLHAYWAAGGLWGSAVVLPEVEGGSRAFTPPPLATLSVAAALISAASILLGRLGLWGDFLPAYLFRWGAWGVALIFLLRAVGDFRFFGFLKRVRGTGFAVGRPRLLAAVLAPGARGDARGPRLATNVRRGAF